MTSDSRDLCAAIVHRRDCGRVTCAIENRIFVAPPSSDLDTVNTFVVAHGFKALGQRWIEIGARAAEKVAIAILSNDLAYNAQIMLSDDAELLAKRFMAMFCESVRCFTNGTHVPQDARATKVSLGWMPISSTAFDAGIVCIDHARVGMLWVEDED